MQPPDSASNEFVIGRTSLSHPIDLTYGAGAVGNVALGDMESWSAGAFCDRPSVPGTNLGTYSRLGLGYFHWGTGSPYHNQATDGLRHLAACGIEYFVGDHLAIYPKPAGSCR